MNVKKIFVLASWQPPFYLTEQRIGQKYGKCSEIYEKAVLLSEYHGSPECQTSKLCQSGLLFKPLLLQHSVIIIP
jgi:hypothetical protein